MNHYTNASKSLGPNENCDRRVHRGMHTLILQKLAWIFLSRGGGQLDANGAPWVIELKRLLGHTLSGH